MGDQLALSFDRQKERRPLAERFEDFHRTHGEVYTLFERFARELKARGRDRYSADAILHRIRWHYATSGPDASGFKINDHYSAMYARKLMDDFPEFAGFFETRAQRSRDA